MIGIVCVPTAKVPENAGAADHWTGKAPFDRVFLADHRDIHVALLEDAIVDYKTQRIIEQFRQFGIEPVANIREQLQWYILMHATGTVISAVNAGTDRKSTRLNSSP